MNDMPEALRKKRDELCMKLYGHRWVSDDRKKEGFNLCYQEIASLIDAVFNSAEYGATSVIRWTPGNQARKVLSELYGSWDKACEALRKMNDNG